MTPANDLILRAELADLLEVQLPALLATRGPVEGDAADVAGKAALEMEIEQLELRIARLTERLESPAPTDGDAPAGVVTLGRSVTVDFGTGPETYRVDQYPDLRSTVASVTVTSPLGAALLGARSGDTVTYSSPAGPQTLTVLSIDSGLSDVA
jgi:transcription elongation factor GreA